MLRVSLLALALSGAALAAQDHLISKRYTSQAGLHKRFILHTNDIHAHLDEFKSSGGDCNPAKDACFGGYARLKTEINQQRANRANDSLLLDAGDQFQGSLFYSAAINGSLISPILNTIGYDAACLGNHEFDSGEGPLSEYLSQLDFPMISCNVETSTNVSQYLVPYVYFEQQNIAVISVLTPETKTIASPDESTSFTDPLQAMQKTVDTVLAEHNTARIIALTHIGYETDIALAKGTRNVHLIVGGHSHTPLGNITGIESVGDYPTIAENLDGDEVFVVTAYRWGAVLGHIDVVYGTDNKPLAYSGGPIAMTNATAQDEQTKQLVNDSRAPFAEYAAEVIGEASVDLSADCRKAECSLGDFVCDASMWYRQRTGGKVNGCIQNGGSVRANISAGEITRGDVLTAFPFGDAVVDVDFTGQELVDVFEGIVSGKNVETSAVITGFAQVGGMNITYNPTLPAGQRLLNLNISGGPVVLDQTYTIVTLDFIAAGGDSFFQKEFSATLDRQDEILLQYIEAQSPISLPSMGRIKLSNSTESAISASASTPVVDMSSGSARARARWV